MENVIEKWVNEEEELKSLLVEIQSMELSVDRQSEVAFNRLCEMYDLPKMPEDTFRYAQYYEANDIEVRRSVFEEYTLLKFLTPENDPRGLVLTAVYHVKMGGGVDYAEIAAKEFGKNYPPNLQIGIRGKGLKGEVVFPLKEGKSWFDLGCIVNSKLQ